MGEVILGSVADSVMGHVVSLISQEIGQARDVKSALNNLRRTVSAITAVLSEAEKRQIEAEDVKDWLKKLSDVVYDADDLLDDFSTEALHRRLMGGNRIWKEVRIFFSSSNRLFYSFKMAHQVKAIRENLDAISKDRLDCSLLSQVNVGNPALGSRVTIVAGNLPEKRVRADTTPHLCEPFVIGRDEDKRKICDFLFDSTPDENVSVLPIVGIGGLGKTTLAKLVFNDKSVQEHFEPKLWVCVSVDFDVNTIVEKTEQNFKDNKKSEDGRMDKLPKMLEGKRFLLVLDDVWNDNRHEWLKLKGYLTNGAKGSKMLVTTRYPRVARTMNHTYHSLEGLPDDESISLLMRMADKQEHEWKNKRLESIGREIAMKCAGVPLAITTVGRLLLFSRDTEEDWLDFVSRDLAELKQEAGDILPMLKLSYDPLPSYMKQCFAYCSLFPKDYELDPDELIHLWMAQGFIRSPDGNRTPEDVGRECFMELVWRSFFQDLEEDEYGNITECKMHDLIHDLAQSVAANNYVTLDSSTAGNFCEEGPRHVSVLNAVLNVKDLQWEGEGHNRIRSFLCSSFSFYSEECSEVHHWEKLISGFRNLRALRLRHNQYDMLKSIGKLKHLRLLNLSGCRGLKALPSSISQLHNLEMLNLSGCWDLTELPRGITKLVNLRRLDIWDGLKLTHLPKGMEKLTNLQVLSTFVVGSKGNSDAAGLDELSRLIGLRKDLSIRQLKAVEELNCLPLQKLKLQSLELSFSQELEWQLLPELSVREEAYLERLKPHSDLKGLQVRQYRGCRFPSWVSQLHQLVRLSIMDCHYCRRLPPIHHLPLLKSLVLRYLTALECIELEERGNRTSAFFPSLMEVEIDDLPLFKGWRWMQGGGSSSSSKGNGTQQVDNDIMLPVFPERIGGIICSCPMFKYVWHRDLSLINVAEELMDQLMGNSKGQAQAKEELMATSPSLISLSSALTAELKSLRVEGTGSMKTMPEEFFHPLTSTQSLEIMNGRHLKSLPWRAILRYLPALEYLCIRDCPELDLSSVVEDEDEADMRLQHGHIDSRILTVCLDGVHMTSLPWWFHHLSNLMVLEIYRCDGLHALSELICSLTSLKELTIKECSGLRSVPRRVTLHLLTTLELLVICDCPEVDLNGELDLDEDDNDDDRTNLQFIGPFTLRRLTFDRVEFLPQWIEHLNNLEELTIKRCENLKPLLEASHSFPSLRYLNLNGCRGLKSPSRRTILHLITTLESWLMSNCEEVDLNGEELDGDDGIANSQLLVPTTLRSLTIKGNKAEFLPWWMEHLNSLEDLKISFWENLKTMPEWFTKLTSLRRLVIHECPLIVDRYLENISSSRSMVFGREITGTVGSRSCREIHFKIDAEKPQKSSTTTSTTANPSVSEPWRQAAVKQLATILATQRLQAPGPNPGGGLFTRESSDELHFQPAVVKKQ